MAYLRLITTYTVLYHVESSLELEQVTGGNSVNQEYMHTSMYLEWPLVQANERRMS
jgi:hypothetical protein